MACPITVLYQYPIGYEPTGMFILVNNGMFFTFKEEYKLKYPEININSLKNNCLQRSSNMLIY
jgi:hypothetical protein